MYKVVLGVNLINHKSYEGAGAYKSISVEGSKFVQYKLWWALSIKQKVVRVVRVIPIQIQLQGWGWAPFKIQIVVGVVRVVKPNYPNYRQILLQGWGWGLSEI